MFLTSEGGGKQQSFITSGAKRSRDHLGADSIRSKLPVLYVPVSPSPVLREASRDLSHSIGPSTMVVFKLRTSLPARPHTVSANIMDYLIFMFRAKRPLDLTAETDVSDQRGRKKTAELHTSDAKRGEA